MRRLFALLGLCFIACQLNAAPLRVVTTISPVQALVAAVTQGVDQPVLLVPLGNSPHVYALKPSDASTLSRADIIFWVGPSLETFLQKKLTNPAGKTTIITLLDAPQLTRLAPRQGGVWEADQDELALPANLSQYQNVDPHIWLDPHNAIALLHYISTAMIQKDPANRAIYQKNTQTAIARLNVLDKQVNAILTPIKKQPFIVFHDAYHYFSARYGLNVVGSVVIEPGESVSAKRILKLQEKIKTLNARCVFREPQFDSQLMALLLKDSKAREGTLDPLGPGNSLDGYTNGITALATQLRDCLQRS
jgi:zinc transport system substrate-binding protein